MQFETVENVRNRWDTKELLQFDERDPCYTWLFPLALGEFDPSVIWRPTDIPRLQDNLTLYVHIPFCRFICSMCPFTHEPLSHRDLGSYVDALCKEIRFYGNLPGIKSRSVTTLYFGGGTASSLTTDHLEKILTELRRWFSFSKDCQITLECHPRTVDKEYLTRAWELGVNRVSFGIQSFQQRFIDSLKLHQKVEQSQQILTDALSVGFNTVAMDLMFRHADQSLKDLEQEIDTALAIGVQGISTYALDPEIRELKGIAKKQKSVNVEGEMYYFLHDRLHAEGFVHVAQPDYAKSGHENLQLRDLWGAPQAENLSLGAGAFSESFNGVTWANVHDSETYVEIINQERVPILMGQVHTWDDAVARYPALGVRCLKFSLEPFNRIFGVNFQELYRLELSVLLEKGWLEIQGDTLIVTRHGKFFIDNISKTFFNLRNRGKSQLWAVQLERLKPKKTWSQQELLTLVEKETTFHTSAY
ncbi:MAG: coproporphyrinogen III oxidase family protein [Desmonostoc vinosum HA7617-LM4]|jgi:oxygen-independent coproporphyrinogen-3 oxidase|nr:coproporphyrinogen III oxidase family protein [Desmonostoc vinosum HA7617-LM4]